MLSKGVGRKKKGFPMGKGAGGCSIPHIPPIYELSSSWGNSWHAILQKIASKGRVGERKKGFPMGKGVGIGGLLYTPHPAYLWAEEKLTKLLACNFSKYLPVKVGERKKGSLWGEGWGGGSIPHIPPIYEQ